MAEPEDRGPQVAAVAILFLTLSWVAVSLRVYVRTMLMKSFGMDDWLAVASLVSPNFVTLVWRLEYENQEKFEPLRDVSMLGELWRAWAKGLPQPFNFTNRCAFTFVKTIRLRMDILESEARFDDLFSSKLMEFKSHL